MSQFNGFNAENKLRIPLSAYAAQIIDNDCLNFSKKKTTLINTIILNYYNIANCSISLRIQDYKKDLLESFPSIELEQNKKMINKLLQKKINNLKSQYAHRHKSEINWQITLNKKVKELLTCNPFSSEEQYYGERPGHYIQSLLEEYSQLPFYIREEIAYKNIIDDISAAIEGKHLIYVTNTKGTRILINPYRILTDPLSMYHYLIGLQIKPEHESITTNESDTSCLISIRISRLLNVEPQYNHSGIITYVYEKNILEELSSKGVPFASGKLSQIKIWLSDAGIKKYNTRIHLRPMGRRDNLDSHIYYFECTEEQAMFYFISFGKDAKILYPNDLAKRFKEFYMNALNNY